MKFKFRHDVYFNSGTASAASKCLATGLTLRNARLILDYYCWYTSSESAELWVQR